MSEPTKEAMTDALFTFRRTCNMRDFLFWADATNVYTQTGLTPTELAGQRAQLLAALQNLLTAMPSVEMMWDNLPGAFNLIDLGARINQARAAISKATG